MPVSLLSTVACLQVCLLVLIVHAEDSFDCSGQDDDSYHPIYDADDCQHYWHCIYVNTVYMHAVRRVCPAGTAFEPTLRQCETSSLVSVDRAAIERGQVGYIGVVLGPLCATQVTAHATNIDDDASVEVEILEVVRAQTLESHGADRRHHTKAQYLRCRGSVGGGHDDDEYRRTGDNAEDRSITFHATSSGYGWSVARTSESRASVASP